MIGAVFRFAHKVLIKCLLALIYGYQRLISPLLGNNCRFSPTCSQYAIEAIKVHGALYGTGLFCLRILKCHPWGSSKHDPVPPAKKEI
ncbi:MAG: membrane protein insertion efficiency factor YidD [Pseudomonadota bacterium]